jgi:hypothetical protein
MCVLEFGMFRRIIKFCNCKHFEKETNPLSEKVKVFFRLTYEQKVAPLWEEICFTKRQEELGDLSLYLSILVLNIIQRKNTKIYGKMKVSSYR